MENKTDYTREELEQILEKAKKELQEKLDRMTPEEREQAAEKANKLIQEDWAAKQKLLYDAAKIAAGSIPKETDAPKFCPNCGAAAGSGNFCEYCGSMLKK